MSDDWLTTQKRRLVAVLTLAVLSIIAASANAQTNVSRIGILGPDEEPRFSEISSGLRQGLRDRGYAMEALEFIERKVARGDSSSARAKVEDFVHQRVALVFVIGSGLAGLARQASADLPIIFITPGDPVEAGHVASLARPGGNTTAITFEFPELSAKRLELLQELSPEIRKVLVLYDPRDASPRQGVAAARKVASKMGLSLIVRETQDANDIMRELQALGEVDAVLAIPGGSTSGHYAAIVRAANAKRLPTMFHSRTPSTADALASYGANDIDIARQAARLVDKILKGEKAGDLPVERPTRLTLAINLKTAKVLGLTISPLVLARADEVIE